MSKHFITKYYNNFYDKDVPPEYTFLDEQQWDPLEQTYPLDIDPYFQWDYFPFNLLLTESAFSIKRRSFIFHPSFADAYWELKKESQEEATEYIEILMNYGVESLYGSSDNEHVAYALYGKFPVIDKACHNYFLESCDRQTKQKRIYDDQIKRDKEKASKGFFCYEDYLNIAREKFSPEKYREFLYALTEKGCYREYNGTDPEIMLLINQICYHMNATDLRYRRSISNGRKGGRKKLFTDDELIEAITDKGLATQKSLAEYFGCNVRTIARRVKSDKVKKYYDARKDKLSCATD